MVIVSHRRSEGCRWSIPSWGLETFFWVCHKAWVANSSPLLQIQSLLTYVLIYMVRANILNRTIPEHFVSQSFVVDGLLRPHASETLSPFEASHHTFRVPFFCHGPVFHLTSMHLVFSSGWHVCVCCKSVAHALPAVTGLAIMILLLVWNVA